MLLAWIYICQCLNEITSEEMPEPLWKIMPCYRAIYRTWDYPIIDGFAYPSVAMHIVTTREAMKIGDDPPLLTW